MKEMKSVEMDQRGLFLISSIASMHEVCKDRGVNFMETMRVYLEQMGKEAMARDTPQEATACIFAALGYSVYKSVFMSTVQEIENGTDGMLDEGETK